MSGKPGLATVCVVSFALLAMGKSESPATEWHQWGGPERNFHSPSTGLATSWPATGPKKLWSRDLGEGYSSIIAASDALFTLYRDADEEVIVALAADSGRTRWEYRYEALLQEHMDYGTWLRQGGAGPYSTPLLLDGTLYTVGVTGRFHAFDAANGTIRWSHDLDQKFAMKGYRGFAPSPIAYGDNVILPIGGSGQGVVAFDRESGDVAWKSLDSLLAAASPILIDVDGEDQLVVFTREELVGVSPVNGERLWSHPHKTQYGLNISTPVWGGGNLLFSSSAYDGGSRVIRLTRANGKTSAEEVWFDNRLRLHFGNAIRVGDLVFGSSGDFGPAFLAAVDVVTGEELWRERTFSRAQMIHADGMLIVVDESGDVALASATRQGLTVHARAELMTENAWTPPTLVGTTLYVRDRKHLVAVDLGE